jgi:hypothetical protein
MECIYVKNLGEAEDKIVEFVDGTLIYEESTQKFYVLQEGVFKPCLPPEANISMTAYELNKQIITQLPNINNEDMVRGLEEINEFIDEMKNVYYMLLCKELSYYTVFVHTGLSGERLCDVVVECAGNVGCVKSIERNEHGAIEIWVSKNEDSYAMYFFPYDGGIVTC